jgi:hypothetical protein
VEFIYQLKIYCILIPLLFALRVILSIRSAMKITVACPVSRIASELFATIIPVRNASRQPK